MILLQHLFDLLEFCAENNTFIQHTPSATGSQNRFSRFPVESATEQQSNLGFPRMEVVQLPFGILNDYDSAQRDDMSVRLRVIVKLSDKYDYAEQVTAMDNAKKALMEMLDYILTAQDDPANENCLICAFDVSSAKYQFIDKLTYGGNAVGCELSIDFKQYIDWENIVYGDLPGYPTFCEKVKECLGISATGDENLLLNQKGEWVEGGGGGAGVWGSITGTITNQTDLVSYITTRLTDYATQAWVTSQGYITNVITALGFTPENVANKQTDLTASATKYPTVNAVNTGLGAKQDTLVSGTNIKTINGNNVLGSGDISISSGIPDAPNDANAYVRSALSWVVGYTKSTIDTLLSAKQNALGYTPVPDSRTLTINGTSYDLSANRSWTVAVDQLTDIRTKGVYFDDFDIVNTISSSAFIHNTYYIAYGGTWQTTAYNPSGQQAWGVVQVNTLNVTASMGFGSNSFQWQSVLGAATFETRVRFEDLSTATNRFTYHSGFLNNATFNANNKIRFSYSDNINSGRFQIECDSGGVSTTADSGITVAADTWYVLRIVINSAGNSVQFFIDGVSVGTIATNIPASGVYPFTQINRSAYVAARQIFVDYHYAQTAITR
jgi:hypothetical protein